MRIQPRNPFGPLYKASSGYPGLNPRTLILRLESFMDYAIGMMQNRLVRSKMMHIV